MVESFNLPTQNKLWHWWIQIHDSAKTRAPQHWTGNSGCKMFHMHRWLTVWLVIISHLDAAFTVGILSQFIQNLGQAHWEGVRRVIAYLGTTKDLWMTFGRCGKMILKGFCDMDWAGQLHRHLILHIHSTWALELSLGAQKSNTSSPCWVLKQSTSHRCMLQRKWCICTCL